MTVDYYPLVNKVLNLFNLKEKMAEEGIHGDQSFIRPFITVAREPGSGGKPIAQAVAAKLGFEFIDEQIIDEIARSTKRRKAIIREVDEKSRTKWADMIHSVLNQEYVDEQTYVYELIQVILAYAHQGKTVILGRGANFITPFAKGLHVNVTAPYQIRVQRAIDFEGHTAQKAKQVIKETETERRDFVKQYFRKDLKKSNAYDLTINTSYFRVDEARDVIIEAFKQKFARSVKGLRR